MSTVSGRVRTRLDSAAGSPSSRLVGRSPCAIWRSSATAVPSSATLWSSSPSTSTVPSSRWRCASRSAMPERDQPLLGAVVQVALQTAALLVARSSSSRARLDSRLARARAPPRGAAGPPRPASLHRSATSRSSSSEAGPEPRTSTPVALVVELRPGRRRRGPARRRRRGTASEPGTRKPTRSPGSRSASRSTSSSCSGRARPALTSRCRSSTAASAARRSGYTRASTARRTARSAGSRSSAAAAVPTATPTSDARPTSSPVDRRRGGVHRRAAAAVTSPQVTASASALSTSYRSCRSTAIAAATGVATSEASPTDRAEPARPAPQTTISIRQSSG